MRRGLLVFLSSAALISVFGAQSADAIPAFARREHVACQMCHFRPPELNRDGQDYLRRGLREEPPQIEEAGEMAPAEVKRPLGEALNLAWANYFSVIGEHEFSAQKGERPEFDGGVITLWFAGPINRNWSGVAVPSFDIEEGESEVEHAYGQYITKWADRFGSGRFGHLRPYAILLNQGGPALPLSTPVVLSTPADTGGSWTPTSFIRGLHLGAVNLEQANVYFGVGQPDLEEFQTSLPGFVNHTDVFAEGEWLLGFLDSSITGYGYWGHSYLSPIATDRPFHRVGAFFNIYGPSTKGTVGYLTGSDEAINGQSLDNSGLFALAEQLFGESWAAYFRYDWFKRDLEFGGDETISGPVIGASWWAASQVWLTVELQFLKQSGEDRNTTFVAHLAWAL